MKAARIVALACAQALLALGVPAAAQAAAVPLDRSSDRLDVVLSQDGSASVAYFTYAPSSGGDATLNVCRIPAGGVQCVFSAAVVLPLDTVTGPWIFSSGNRVTAVAGSYDGATEGTCAITSANGTSSWSTPMKIAPITAKDVELAPSGNRLYVASRYQFSSQAVDDASFSSAPIPGLGGPGDGNASALLESNPTFSGDDQQVGVRPDGRPLAFISGAGSAVYSYAFEGVAGNNAQLNDPGRWGGRSEFSAPAPFTRNGGYEAATGAGRLWFGYDALSTELLLRQYSGTGFGTPVNPDCTSRRFAAGAQGPPALAIGRTGLLHVAYAGSDGTNLHLGYFLGTADGTAFSPYQEIYTGPDEQRDIEIAADPTSDAGGIVVWTANAITGGPMKFARLPAATPAACPAPPADPVGQTPGATAPPVASVAPSVAPSTTAPVTPQATPAPIPAAPAKTKTTSSTSGGASYELETPGVCVPVGATFSVALTYAKTTKKNNAFVKVARVDFSGTRIKTRTDTKAPFRQTLKVPTGTKRGKTISVKIRAFVKVKRGASPVKSLSAKVQVCA